jgi:hypothetical protein
MKRPLCATFLLWSVLTLSGLSGVRLGTTIYWWLRLSPFISIPMRIYLIVGAFFWLCVSLIILLGLIKGVRWSLEATGGAAILFSIWYWIDRLVLTMPGTNWYFSLVVTMLLLICVILCARHPRTRTFFYQRETNDE